jgi:hypothetical protein
MSQLGGAGRVLAVRCGAQEKGIVPGSLFARPCVRTSCECICL